eukprot:TRINITY_DN3851_c7_g1_i1.p1 TRINITY_DN3851_c7_g1~~TRINITY_DN3851_c7_g1_i1.p1  ORF type:complete len:472 (+),score=83.35 TRINITY_DN3851_c7_g1_i1:43-1416(+)
MPPAKKTNLKGTNPLAMLKAVQKKKTNIRKKKEVKAAEEAAKIEQEKGCKEVKDADRGTTAVNKTSTIDTPIYCKDGINKDYTTRVRCGVPLVDVIQARTEEKQECDNNFLMSLLRTRLDHIEDHVVHVYNYYPPAENSAVHMNMPAHLRKPCISLMGKYDFTYGAIYNCEQVISSSACISTLNPIERLDGKDYISHAFCLVYQLFLLRTSSRTCQKLLKRHAHKPYAVAILMMYMRYIMSPLDFIRSVSRQLITNDEDSQVVVGEGKSVTLSRFTEMLLAPDTTDEFFEVFPPFSEEEAKVVKTYSAKVKQTFKIPTEQEQAEKKKKLMEEKRTARLERKQMVTKLRHTTLVPGFTDASTLMNWADYRAAVEGHTAEAVSADLVKRKLLLEREKFEQAQQAAEARRRQEVEETAAALKKKKASSKKKQPAPTDEDNKQKRSKVEKPKLQQVQDSYL